MSLRRMISGFAGLLGLVLALVWAIARSSFTITSSIEDLLEASRLWPDRSEVWFLQFYADSPAYIIFAKALGIDDTIGLVRQSFMLGLVAVAALAVWAWRLSVRPYRWQGARLVVLAPLSAILFSAIGSYDSFTALAWAAALWMWCWRRPSLMILSGALLGMQHFEQALLGSFSLFLVWLAIRSDLPTSIRQCSPLWLVPGVIAGKALLVGYFLSIGTAPLGRAEWLQEYLAEWAKVGVVTLPFLLWSLFAGLWLAVFLIWIRSDQRARILLLAALIPGILGTLMSGDRPRVFVLIMLPAVLIAIVAFTNRPSSRGVDRKLVEFLAWVGPPVILFGADAVNANVIDNAYVSFMWITGLMSP